MFVFWLTARVSRAVLLITTDSLNFVLKTFLRQDYVATIDF